MRLGPRPGKDERIARIAKPENASFARESRPDGHRGGFYPQKPKGSIRPLHGRIRPGRAMDGYDFVAFFTERPFRMRRGIPLEPAKNWGKPPESD